MSTDRNSKTSSALPTPEEQAVGNFLAFDDLPTHCWRCGWDKVSHGTFGSCNDARRAHRKTAAAPLVSGLRFPTELRKMWSGTEVQAWLDSHGEVIRLRDIPEGCTPTDARVLRDANHKLAEQVEQLRMKTERYDFLRDENNPWAIQVVGVQGKELRKFTGGELDATIDAALRAKGAQR